MKYVKFAWVIQLNLFNNNCDDDVSEISSKKIQYIRPN